MKEKVCRIAWAVLLTAMGSIGMPGARGLSLQERLEAQRAIERVYWEHRIWPRENSGPKPPFSAVMSEAAIRARVEDSLRKSNALAKIWKRPVTTEQLQAEFDRMARNSRDRVHASAGTCCRCGHVLGRCRQHAVT
jgi:hypothetical protein